MKKPGGTAVSLIMLLAVLCGMAIAHEENRPAPQRQSDDRSIDYAVEGEFAEARAELTATLKKSPYNAVAELSLRIIDDVLSSKISTETAAALFRGIALYNDGKFDEAITEYDKALVTEPGYAPAFMKRSIASANKGDADSAISDCTRALGIEPDHPLAYVYRGVAYSKKGDFDKAIADYNRAIEIDSRDPDAYYNRGVSLAKRGQHVPAILDYDRVIELNPDYTNAYTNRGFIYLVTLENRERACADWKKACDLGSCSNYALAQKEDICP